MFRYLLRLLLVGAIVSGNLTNVFGQEQTGCLLPNGRIHYQENGVHGGKTNYNTNPNVLISTVFCVTVVTTNPNCRVNKKKNAANQGTKRKFYLVQCPLDDYVPLIILAIGGLGFFSIRKLKPAAI
ncbi:hypothetical protein [Pedobacter insulae]|nr:hypothetical protein [Pedobacter insulae]